MKKNGERAQSTCENMILSMQLKSIFLSKLLCGNLLNNYYFIEVILMPKLEKILSVRFSRFVKAFQKAKTNI